MINVFFCPTVLNNMPVDDPKEFEKTQISAILNLKDLCEGNSTGIKILSHSIERYIQNAPWDKMADNVWKGYLLEWKQVVFPFLYKYMVIVKQIEAINCDLVTSYGENEAGAWSFLLSKINEFLGRDCWPLVVSSTICHNDFCQALNKVNVNNLKEGIHYILYPWLKCFDDRLPANGEYPYIPPKDWDKSGNVPRGEHNGYLDGDGNEWVHDMERKNHWDVQLKNGSHINVSYEGKII